jgi:hypothetical protein
MPPPSWTPLTMCILQALRRSLKNGDKDKVNHISITPKSAIAIVPPKKVCDCLPPESAIDPLTAVTHKGNSRIIRL